MMIGTGVRELRDRLGMTQAQLGKRLGISATTVYRWEAGRSPVSEVVALALRKLELDLAHDWVLNIINGIDGRWEV